MAVGKRSGNRERKRERQKEEIVIMDNIRYNRISHIELVKW